MNKVIYSSKSNEWETPIWLFNKLNEEFNFYCDVAATKNNHLCEYYFTEEENSLLQDWSIYKNCFCNPPYGKLISKFIQKGYEESLKGCNVVFLIPARTDTKWWHEYCSKGEVRFIKGRLKFQNRTFPSWKSDGSHKISPANFPSAIVIFKKQIEQKTIYVNYKEKENVT